MHEGTVRQRTGRGHARVRAAALAGAVLLMLVPGCSALPSRPVVPVREDRAGFASSARPAGALPVGAASVPAAPAPELPTRKLTIAAVGDLLMHLPLVDQARLPDTGDYDFTPIFASALPILQAADLAVANLETTLAGPDWPWSGYPAFNTPPEFARDLRRMGFDVVTNANNHSLDYGQKGLLHTIDYLDQAGLPHTGTFKSPADRNQPLILERSGVRVAFLAYTYGTNGIPVPEPHLVNLLDPELIVRDIAAARATADLVSVSLHFGNEDVRQPDQAQGDLVRTAIAAGADLILGGHPHVLQPIEWVQAGGRRGLVIYSLGNFVSNQRGLPNNTGLILLVQVEKAAGQPARPIEAGYVLTYTQQRRVGGALLTRVLPIEQALHDYENGLDPLLGPDDHQQLRQAWAEHVDHVRGSPTLQALRILRPALGPSTVPLLLDR